MSALDLIPGALAMIPVSPDRLFSDVFVDLFLLISFAALHSALLVPEGRQLMGRLAPKSLHGTLYAFSASASLLMTILCWRPLPGVLWELHGLAKWLVIGVYVGSWIIMAKAMADTGALRQNGIEQWWNTLRRKPTLYPPCRAGLYKVWRHPIYVGFLGMIWVTPRMTSGHLLLALTWSLYIALGATWKEGRMLARAGDYDDYARRVPPFPFFPRRPLREIWSAPQPTEV